MGKGLGIAGFVVSLVVVAIGWVLGVFTPFAAITGLVLSAVAKGKAKKAGVKNGLATAGLVLGIIATVCVLPVAIILMLAA